MRYELTDQRIGGPQAVPAEQGAQRATGERPACAQRDLLGVAIGGPWRDLPAALIGINDFSRVGGTQY